MRVIQVLINVVFSCLAFTMTANASDYLNPDRPVTLRFSIASRADDGVVFVSVTFQSDGLQMVAPGGTVLVNGGALNAAPLPKQGYWYTAQVSKSAQYQLEYTLGPGKPMQRRVILERAFSPVLPKTVSRGSGLTLAFVGLPLRAGERIFSDITGGDGPSRWGEVLRASAEGNRVVVNAKSLTAARLGSAKLYVGVVVKQVSPTGDYVALHTSGADAMVQVID